MPLIAGILYSHYSDFNPAFFSIIACVLVMTLFLVVKPKSNVVYQISFTAITSLFFFLTGSFLIQNSDSQKSQQYFTKFISQDSTNYFKLKLISYPDPSEKWIKFQAEILEVNDEHSIGKSQIYFQNDTMAEMLNYGDLIFASASFIPVNEPANPFEFNYKNYLAHHDIHHQTFVKSGLWKKCGNNGNPILAGVFNIRQSCAEIIDGSNLSGENKAVSKALLLGDKEMISDELMLSYAASGTLHVLAVSGLHVGIVMLILSFILQPLKRLKKGKLLFLIFALSGIWFYTLLTGFSPSILRAAVMFTFVLIGNELQRDTSIYQSLFFSALILILIDPHILFQIGFLLSYLAVFGIVFFHPKIYSLIFFKYKWADKIWQITSVSIAAQIATFPLAIYCFHQFPNYFLLANLIVIPVSFLILVIGIMALVFFSVPLVGDFLFYILDFLLNLMNAGVRITEKIPYAITENLIIAWYDVLLIYGLILTITYAILLKSKRQIFASLFILSLLSSSFFIQKLKRFDNNVVLFYSVKNEIHVDVITNSTITSITSSDTTNQISKQRFHIDPARLNLAGKTNPDSVYNLTDGSPVISIDDYRILFLNQHISETLFTDSIPKTELVYISNASYLQTSLVSTIQNNKTPVILGEGISNSLKKFLIRTIEPTLQWDLKSKGSFVVRI